MRKNCFSSRDGSWNFHMRNDNQLELPDSTPVGLILQEYTLFQLRLPTFNDSTNDFQAEGWRNLVI